MCVYVDVCIGGCIRVYDGVRPKFQRQGRGRERGRADGDSGKAGGDNGQARR